MPHPKAIFQIHNIHPQKSLGQNFLFDDNILTKIVDAGNLIPTDVVIEIGAGLGHLTEHLAQYAQHVYAVELDDRLLPILNNVVSVYENVTVIHGDVLETNWATYTQEQPYKVIANVPYYITGAILRFFLETPNPPHIMVLTVQKEVCERLLAEPGQLSILAISAQFFGTIKRIGQVKAGAFWPPPNVDSAIVQIDLTQAPSWGVPASLFFRVVKAGFAQKRKQLKNNLYALSISPEIIHNALQQTGIAGSRRAQTLSIPEWVSLTQALYPNGE